MLRSWRSRGSGHRGAGVLAPCGMLALLALVVGCAGSSDAPEALDSVWNGTLVDIMGQPPMPVSALGPVPPRGQSRSPAVVYLHGCNGRGNTAHSHIRFLKLQGYAVFAPHHGSRPNAQADHCDGNTARRFARPEINRLHHAEARRIRRGLRGLSWIDQERVMLVGHSDGANAAASYPHDGDFAKIVAIAGDCRHGIAHNTLLLTIASQNDAWHARSSRKCKDFSGPKFESLTVLGGDHNFILDASHLAPPEEEARDTILEFLARQDRSRGIKLRIGG